MATLPQKRKDRVDKPGVSVDSSWKVTLLTNESLLLDSPPTKRIKTDSDEQKIPELPNGNIRDTEAADISISKADSPHQDALKSLARCYTNDNVQGISIYYPRTSQERAQFKNKLGKTPTPHQWAVYDYLLTIPKGKVSTYKCIALAIGGSPRSAGTALRNNPFAPYVPCHRVIASNLFIGGYMGEWGERKSNHDVVQCGLKRKLLEDEGVSFDAKGFLMHRPKCLWKPI